MINYQIQELESNLGVFKHLLDNAHDALILWKYDKENWNYLEIICHLVDEEKEDFRIRLEYLLSHPDKELIPIDPTAWIKDRSYAQQDFNFKKEEFIKERKNSLQFLKALDVDDPGWFNTRPHKYFGQVSPQFFLNNWVAHDLLHLRQLIKIKYDYMASISDHSLEYAGEWK